MKYSLLAQPMAMDAGPAGPYDLAIATTGYEARARYLFEKWQPQSKLKWAPAFTNRQELSFEANDGFFKSNGYDTTPVDDVGFRAELTARMQNAGKVVTDKARMRVLIDVSSMSRLRMARIVEAVAAVACMRTIIVDCVYSVAEYVAPPVVQYPISDCGPVTHWFSGWSPDPSFPTVAVFGAGYEQDQVIGVLDVLEAAELRVFVPEGPDTRYSISVNKANATLWGEVPRPHRLKYKVLDPYETFLRVESLLYGLSANKRPIVIPFGPKIFAICCMLASAATSPPVSLWRVSTGQGEPASERQASGHLCGIAAEFRSLTGN